MSDGDEVFRAIMDKSCQFSQFQAYTLEFVNTGQPVTAAAQFQMNTDTHFLVMQVAPYIIDDFGQSASGRSFYVSGEWPMTIDFERPSTSQTYSFSPDLTSLWGNNMQRAYTMPQYWYLRPSDIIRGVFTNLSANRGATAIIGAALIGIEYRK